MKDRLNILKRHVGDVVVPVEFETTVDTSAELCRIVATRQVDGQVLTIGEGYGAKAGRKAVIDCSFIELTSGTYTLQILDEDDEEVAKGALLMFGIDGFTIEQDTSINENYWLDENGDFIVDHNGEKIVTEAA